MHAALSRLGRFPRLLNGIRAFLLSAWFSNVGAQVFLFSFPIYAASHGLDVPTIGVVLAVGRLTNLASILLVGIRGDSVNPQQLLFWSEIVGAMTSASFLVLACFDRSLSAGVAIMIFIVRSLALGLQVPIRAKIGKLIVTNSTTDIRAMAINLNMLSQGTALFSAVVMLLFIKSMGFIGVCIFDLLSFLMSGFVARKLRISAQTSALSTSVGKVQLFATAARYFRSHKRLLITEILLHLPVWGTQTLFVRVVGERNQLLPYCWMMYGFTVILSAGLSKYISIKDRGGIAWWIQAASFLMAAFYFESFWISLISLGFVYLSYFYLWHFVSAEFQVVASHSDFAALSSIRALIAALIIGSGDFVVGFGSKAFPVSFEYYYRCIICILIGTVSITFYNRKQFTAVGR